MRRPSVQLTGACPRPGLLPPRRPDSAAWASLARHASRPAELKSGAGTLPLMRRAPAAVDRTSPRAFGRASEEPYRRRASDWVRLVVASGLLALLAERATYVSAVDEQIFQLFNLLPRGLEPVFRSLERLGGLWAVGLVGAAAVVGRRGRLARDLLDLGNSGLGDLPRPRELRRQPRRAPGQPEDAHPRRRHSHLSLRTPGHPGRRRLRRQPLPGQADPPPRPTARRRGGAVCPVLGDCVSEGPARRDRPRDGEWPPWSIWPLALPVGGQPAGNSNSPWPWSGFTPATSAWPASSPPTRPPSSASTRKVRC